VEFQKVIKRINHLSRKQSLLSFILLLTFVVGIIQVIPFATTSSMQQDGGSTTEVNVETHDDASIIEDLEIQEPVSTYQTALDPPVYDYVDSHYYDGYGSTTNFANMRSSSTSYATLTEAPTSSTTIEFEDYWYPWMSEDYSSTEWCEVEVDGKKDFHLEENGGQGSSTSNFAAVSGDFGAADSGGILSPQYDLSSAQYFVFSVYIYDSLLAHEDELEVYFRDSSANYDRMFDWDDCGTPVSGWRYKELTVSDPQYLYNGFRIRYESIDINILQETGVDDHRVVAYGSNQLDQRFSFTNVNYNEYRFEYLEIEFDIPATEPLIIECWSGAAWVQIGQKSSSGMSQMYVYAYLTSSTFNVRLRDYDTTYDTSANSWRIEELRLKMYDHIPENYANPKCDSFYDTDNIYAMKTPRGDNSYAYITTYHSDADGWADIQYCGVAGYSGATRLWEVTYSNSGNSYSAYTGSSHIAIEPGTATKSGDTIVIVWHIRFLWTHPDLLNMDIRCRTQDTSSNMNTNFILGWDVETRLQSALLLADNGDDTRGEINGVLIAEGIVVYYGSGSLQYPPDNAVDVYITSTEVSESPWSALYDNDMWGAQYWTYVTADDQVGLDYYRSKVVAAGTGSGGTDLLVTDDSVSFISDRITVLGYSVSDARVNVDTGVYIYADLEYEYDNTAVTSGNVTINGHNATHMGDGIWRILRAESSVIAQTFNDVNVTSDPYGITVENQNGQETTVIWDGLVITMTDPDDARINVGDTATGISSTAVYSFDGTAYDGSLLQNSTTYVYGTVGMRGYTVVSASGDSYDITTILSNDETWCIWDEVEVIQLGSTLWNLVNESFQVWCNLQLAYDNHPLGAGDSVLIADEAATWNGTHFVLDISFPTVRDLSFYLNSTYESTYGISLIGGNAEFLVHVTDMPSIDSIDSDFEAANGLYQGVYSGSTLWIHWDPVNDATAPSFNFTVGGAYFHVWNVTSSWSGLVLVGDISTGTFVCILEAGLPYSESNYTYTIFAINEGGYSVTQIVYITVRDYTAPVVVSEPLDIELTEGDIGYSIIWTCSDANPQSFAIRLDAILIDNDDWLTSPENMTVSLDGLDAGEYVYEITIYDESGNFVQDSVTVVVNEITTTTTTSTTTTTTTTPTTTNTTTTGPADLLLITIVIVIGGVVIVVIIIIIVKRR